MNLPRCLVLASSKMIPIQQGVPQGSLLSMGFNLGYCMFNLNGSRASRANNPATLRLNRFLLQ